MDGLLLAYGAAAAIRRRLELEWFGTPPHLLMLGGRKPQGLAAHPHDLRPADPERGSQIVDGVFTLAGSTLRVGANGDPFDRPSPNRRFALALHRFDWLRDLLAAGDSGVRPGVRLYMDWRRLFGRWNAFAWSGEVLERRVFNLACAVRPLTTQASEAETDFLLDDLARQARHLLGVSEDLSRAAERAAAAAIAGCALGGPAGDALIKRGLRRLQKQLAVVVAIDGGHATRSPQRGLELLLDLLTLDDALSQRARPTPEPITRAIDRLGAATRFFTLADGRLAAFQGGEAVDAATIAAALAHEEARKSPLKLPQSGYHKLHGVSIEVIADAGAPARGAWSLAACAQPLALEIVCGRDRLITGSGWTPEAVAPSALRVTGAASTATLGEASCGEPLRGFVAKGLGERLVGTPAKVEVQRHETEAAMWLEMSHDGWMGRFGLMHERRLFLDRASGELRGEDRFEPPQPKEEEGRRYIPFTVHFHIPPDVDVSLAHDGKTVILRGPSNEGRWLRTDAAQVAIEPAAQVVEGETRRTSEVVLRGQVLSHKGGRVRWKLSPSESLTSPARGGRAYGAHRQNRSCFVPAAPDFPPAPDRVPVKRALLSVSDKTGLIETAKALSELGVELISTGGTKAAIAGAGLAVKDVSDLTGFPEMMDGRVKTLHPVVHGGLLGVRDAQSHAAAMAEHGIGAIDLLYVNLYPFEGTVAGGGNFETCVENIDIGGPAMIRSAAKNHGYVAVCTEPSDIAEVVEALKADGATSLALRKTLAARAYARTAAYDAAISGWFAGQLGDEYPARKSISGSLRQTMRYGENPHQSAAFYAFHSPRPGVATARQLQGKELSYNNIADTDAAYELVAEFAEPACAIIKHANPCGVAMGADLKAAYARALECDPVSAFGGIVAVNRPLDAASAEEIVKIFTEVVIAPGADEAAIAVFAAKKNLRLLLTDALPDPLAQGEVFRSVAGGFLVQGRDRSRITAADLKIVTKRQPTEAEVRDMLFAFTVAKHVKSNAIVFAKDGQTAGIGAGQMNRRDSARIAAIRAAEAAETAGYPESLAKGSACASEAFFPFPDGLLQAAEAGATAVIQPGGSIRDDEVIAAADEAGVAMAFTGVRVFRH